LVKGFEDLSEYTRQWMADTVASNALIRKHCHKLGSRLALDGQFVLENITVTEFTAPRVKYSPSKNSLLYISTDEGYIEVYIVFF
jgi:hypothetical protein